MPRQVRIEFPGAMYHVMARGDRREAIVRDDEDRRTFVRTLGQACERAGLRVHGWVLMTNHCHLLLETPEGNLSRGMGWMQNAFTRRLNTRHRLWGHVFGDRYKAIVVEPGNCYWAVLDYIHLNPVRAGMVTRGEGLESYLWSSLPGYGQEPGQRTGWLETGLGLQVAGCEDGTAGRRRFLEVLEERIDWEQPGRAGVEFRKGEGEPEVALRTALRRGWFFGGQAFREKLLGLVGGRLGQGELRRSDGYSGKEVREHGEQRAERLLAAGLQVLGVDAEGLRGARCNDWRKGLLAGALQAETTVKLDPPWPAGPGSIIWDGLRAHWSKEVRAYVETLGGAIDLEQLPAYAPELNPVEYLWGHIKQHELANLCPKDLHELSSAALKALFKAKRTKFYIRAFWIQAELPL
jgi:putative transposase